MKNAIITLLIVVIAGFGIYFLTKGPSDTDNQDQNTQTTPTPQQSNQANETPSMDDKPESIVGKSVENRDIVAYNYGTGDKKVLFIGGIHGGYSWNTSLVAYELMDYLEANPTKIPNNVKVTVIPVMNPDGLAKVVSASGRFTKADVSSSQSLKTAGRFNANTVDLNRNFDCDWKASGKWQTTTVSGGTAAFSEPESQVIKTYIETQKPNAIIVWYSAAGGVFSSSCHNGISTETSALTDLYAKASGYKAYEEFDFYEITGDMVNWFAKENIPAISVLLTSHESTE